MTSIAQATEPPPEIATFDQRYDAAPDLFRKQEILLEVLRYLNSPRSAFDGGLVWRLGAFLGGEFSETHHGELIRRRRVGEAPATWIHTRGAIDPKFQDLRWDSETSRVYWIEYLHENGHVPGANTSNGEYRFHTTPEFYALMSAEVEEAMIDLLKLDQLDGSDLRLQMLRCLFFSHRVPKPEWLVTRFSAMRPNVCGKKIAAALRAIHHNPALDVTPDAPPSAPIPD